MTARRGLLALAAAALLLAGCADGAAVGRRYRAERALWRLNHEWQRLAIRPDLVSDADRDRLAAGYVELGRRFGGPTAPGDSSEASRAAVETRAVAARALLTAADIYRGSNLLERADSLYRAVETGFPDLPRMAAEGALDRGRLAEAEGRVADAAAAYRRVLGLVPPRLGDRGVQGEVLSLPLHVARLEAGQAADTTAAARSPYYDQARQYYQRVVERAADPALRLQARSRMVDIATDLGRWGTAVGELTALDRDVAADSSAAAAVDRGEIRYALAEAWRRSGRPDSSVAVLEALIQDSPRSEFAPRALLALAADANRRGDTQAALDDLDRMPKEYPDAEEERASALLLKARILEHADRWPKALEIYRSLPVEHPLSVAALSAPLDVVEHYSRSGEAQARGDALDQAEKTYREFLQRYPSAGLATGARARLAQVMILEKRYPEAVDELARVASDRRRTPQGVAALLQAADLAYGQAGDTTRAAELLDQGAEWYQGTDFARRIREAADRLRRGEAP